MPAAPTLLELQRGFAAALTGSDDALAPWIAACGIDATSRLRIYRNACFATHVETLFSVFPAVARWVGEACFDGLATRFAASRGSRSGNLQDFGDGFPDFLRGQPELAAWPWLPELAQLEWLRQQCALAEECPVAHADAMIAAIATDGDELPLGVQPHARVLSATAPVLERWRMAMEAESPSLQADAPQAVLLWRERGEVPMTSIDLPLAAFVQALADGAPFASAIAAACQDGASPESLLLPLLERRLLALAPAHTD